MDSPSPLSPEDLAATLERHIEATAARFQEVAARFQEVSIRFQEVSVRFEEMAVRSQEMDRRIHSLTGQVEALVGLMREQGLRLTALEEHQAEQRAEILRILHRLEQHDGQFQEVLRRLEQHDQRLEEHSVFIRRMLENLERRGGDGRP